MSKQLYEEALADVKKLKEIAEDNAKKALIEAVSPRIKDLIEAELLREVEEFEKEEDGLLLDDGMESPEAAGSIPMSSIGDPSSLGVPTDDEKVTLDLDKLAISPSEEEYELSNQTDDAATDLVGKLNLNFAESTKVESKLFRLSESAETFSKVRPMIKALDGFQKKVSEAISEVESLYQYLQESAGNLQGKGAYEEKLEDLYKKLNKLVEQDNMKKNLKSLTEAEISLKLTNVPDELEDALDQLQVELSPGEGSDEDEEDLDLGGEGEEGEEEVDLDLGDEDEDEAEDEEVEEEGAMPMESLSLTDNVVVEIDENMLRQEIGRMRALREASESADVQSWGHDAGEVADGFEDEDMGDPFVDVELTTEGDADAEEVEELDELDQAMYQGVDRAAGGRRSAGQSPSAGPGAGSSKRGRSPGSDVEEAQKDEKEMEEDEQVQEVRHRLTREFRIQTEAKKKAQTAKKQQKEAQKKSQQKQLEAQQKAKQKKQQEAQKAKLESQKQAKQAKKMQEAYAYYANIFNESVRRTAKLQSVLIESRKEVNLNGTSTKSAVETNNLRKKLAETNLFNMKLLYSNKLLQNESLTKRQKAEVIERLDEASSEREVKLVYESLVKALAGTSRPIAENASRVIGSSSQATRPASTVIAEGYEADRWAKLAGIK